MARGLIRAGYGTGAGRARGWMREEVIPVDKEILSQYIDACELIKETEEDIRRVKRQRKTILQDRVHGSMKEFPYTAQSFKIQGMAYSVVSEPGALEAYEHLLEERKADAERIKVQVETWMNAIPQRMQRIIRYAIFQKFSWGEVAAKLGRKATADSARKEFERFLEEK